MQSSHYFRSGPGFCFIAGQNDFSTSAARKLVINASRRGNKVVGNSKP